MTSSIKRIFALLTIIFTSAISSLIFTAPSNAQSTSQQLVGKPVGGLSRSLNNDDGKQKSFKERRQDAREKMKNKRKNKKERATQNSANEEQRTASKDNQTTSRTKSAKQSNQRKAKERRANNRQAQKSGNSTTGTNLND